MRENFPNKVHPCSHLRIIKTPLKGPKHYLCLCTILKLCIFPMRLIGRFPYSWHHLNGKCTYILSSCWMLYSCILMTLLAVVSIYVMPFLEFHITNLPVFLDSLTNVFSAVYWSLAILYIWNVNLWARIVEGLIKASADHLFCLRAKKLTINFQKSLLTLIAAVFTFQNAAFVFFTLFSSCKLPLHVLFFRNMNIMPTINYLFWFSCIQYCTALLICFENVACNYLGYQHIHPKKSIDLTHNEYQFSGFSTPKKMCDERHFMPHCLEKLTRVEIIEYLRISHEGIYEVVLLFQQFTSPQLLACIVVEVSILIINMYSAMIYLMYQSDKVITTSTFVFNCISVVAHFTGFFWFFQKINSLMKIVHGLKPILVACSLSAQSDEEHQQFRIFINKVANQRPFSMNDFFSADLGVIGPVIGSILTYLLVALQFDIPAQKHN